MKKAGDYHRHRAGSFHLAGRLAPEKQQNKVGENSYGSHVTPRSGSTANGAFTRCDARHCRKSIVDVHCFTSAPIELVGATYKLSILPERLWYQPELNINSRACLYRAQRQNAKRSGCSPANKDVLPAAGQPDHRLCWCRHYRGPR